MSRVRNDFKEALTEMKDELKKEEWIFPTLQANMRNQVNIANVNVEKGNRNANHDNETLPIYFKEDSIKLLKLPHFHCYQVRHGPKFLIRVS